MKKSKIHVLGNLLTIQRKLNLSVAEFAEHVGLSQDSMRNLMTGQNNPSLDTLIFLSQKLDVSMDDLCTEGALSQA